MSKIINQIAGFLKMKLFGQSSGMDVPLAADGDGHLQLDILTQPALSLNAHEAKLMGLSGAAQKQLAVDADGHQQLDVVSLPTLTVQFSTGTATPSEINPDDAGAAGASSLASKEDHAHGFPCGTPGITTLGDASAEGSGADAARSDHKHKFIETGLAHGRFERKDTTTGRMVGLPGTSKRIEVGGDYTNLASDIERALTAGNYLLNADGSISSSNPAANTIYYAYLLGPGHSTGPNQLRYSATAPNSNGYLGTTGNAAQCRHVGWIRTDASTQLTNSAYAHSRFNGRRVTLRNTLGSGTFSNANAYTFEDIGISHNFLWPPNWSLDVKFTADGTHAGSGKYVCARAFLVAKNEFACEVLYVTPAAGSRIGHGGGCTWQGGATPVFETAKLQGFTDTVSPTTTTFYLASLYSDMVITLLPEEQ